ncbi:hypothetical protein C8J57DRAFT_1518811 [Mycena rebaudengoi]|nr:hypothetical protein C8J57DRAFT_1518811 [Mycena rebaudengoi]
MPDRYLPRFRVPPHHSPPRPDRLIHATGSSIFPVSLPNRSRWCTSFFKICTACPSSALLVLFSTAPSRLLRLLTPHTLVRVVSPLFITSALTHRIFRPPMLNMRCPSSFSFSSKTAHRRAPSFPPSTSVHHLNSPPSIRSFRASGVLMLYYSSNISPICPQDASQPYPPRLHTTRACSRHAARPRLAPFLSLPRCSPSIPTQGWIFRSPVHGVLGTSSAHSSPVLFTLRPSLHRSPSPPLSIHRHFSTPSAPSFPPLRCITSTLLRRFTTFAAHSPAINAAA